MITIPKKELESVKKEIMALQKQQEKIFSGFIKKYKLGPKIEDWIFDLVFNDFRNINESLKALGVEIK